MNSLHVARDALKAELKNARAGMAHYETMAARLEAVLATLSALKGAPTPSKPSRSKRIRSAVAPKKPMGRPARRATKAIAAAGDMPSTGGEFWINLITEQPKPARDILKAAVEELDFAPTKEQVRKLSNRMAVYLSTLVASKKIQNSGAGRDRRYFRRA